MYIIAVNKLQEFLLNVRRLFIYFFDDNARDSTVLSTTSYTNPADVPISFSIILLDQVSYCAVPSIPFL